MTIETDYHPAVRALLGGAAEEPDHPVTCAWCGKMTMCPSFVWSAVREWNRIEGALAVENDRKANFIHGRDMGVCCEGECTQAMVKERHREQQVENWTTIVYLRDLRAGRYTVVSLEWLRSHGHAGDVTKILNEEGNSSHG